MNFIEIGNPEHIAMNRVLLCMAAECETYTGRRISVPVFQAELVGLQNNTGFEMSYKDVTER